MDPSKRKGSALNTFMRKDSRVANNKVTRTKTTPNKINVTCNTAAAHTERKRRSKALISL